MLVFLLTTLNASYRLDIVLSLVH